MSVVEMSYGRALWRNFLGQSPDWYKLTLIIFLIVNPLVFYLHPFIAGWLLVIEFIFTTAMALKCYPLLPGGLLAIEAVFIGMTTPGHIRAEVAANLEVLLLLMFMVAGIYFMKQLLLFIFTRLLLGIRSKMLLSLAFCVASAFLSAFLDALTVVAVVISVAVGFYGIYHKVASARPDDDDMLDDSHIEQHYRDVLGAVSRLPAQPDDARRGRHRARRRDDDGWRTAEPDYRQSRGLALRRILHAHAAGKLAGAGLRPAHLPAAGEIPPVWLRRTAAANRA